MWRRTDGRPGPLRLFAAALCLLLAAWFLYPLSMGILHIGMVWPAALLLLAASLCLFPRWYARLPRGLVRVCTVALGAGLAVALAVLAIMASAAAQGPNEADPPLTVIVPGCQVHDDGTPSVMLRSRIRAAYDYLAAHPEAVCVASGSMADDETISEASCIRNTLIAMGIAPERIVLEERSGSTYENMTYSAACIRDLGLDVRVAVATDDFHQYRCRYYGRRSGLEPCAVCCEPYVPLAPGYWCREAVAVLAAWIRGY